MARAHAGSSECGNDVSSKREGNSVWRHVRHSQLQLACPAASPSQSLSVLFAASAAGNDRLCALGDPEGLRQILQSGRFGAHTPAATPSHQPDAGQRVRQTRRDGTSFAASMSLYHFVKRLGAILVVPVISFALPRPFWVGLRASQRAVQRLPPVPSFSVGVASKTRRILLTLAQTCPPAPPISGQAMARTWVEPCGLKARACSPRVCPHPQFLILRHSTRPIREPCDARRGHATAD